MIIGTCKWLGTQQAITGTSDDWIQWNKRPPTHPKKKKKEKKKKRKRKNVNARLTSPAQRDIIAARILMGCPQHVNCIDTNINIYNAIMSFLNHGH